MTKNSSQTSNVITDDAAAEICQILDEELDADFQFDPTVAQAFMRYITTHEHVEWRIWIGMGVKFRNGGGHGLRVDCYPSEAISMPGLKRRIARANKRLGELEARRG